MNKKANYWMVIVILAAFFLVTGLVVIEDGKIIIPSIDSHKYLSEIQLDNNITFYEGLEIDILIKNPDQASIYPELEIEYDTIWKTSNIYVQGNQKIPIGSIKPRSLERYSIKFLQSYSKPGIYTFKFKLYTNNALIDEREEIVHVT